VTYDGGLLPVPILNKLESHLLDESVASVGSVLKVYSAIFQQKPDAKSKLLDDLLKKQIQGKLDEALGRECK
jgi:hypothetical protein